MSIDGGRHYVVKAKENTDKVWKLLNKRKFLKTEGVLEIEKTPYREYRSFVYKFDNFKLSTPDEDGDERYFFWAFDDSFECGKDCEQITNVYFDTKCNFHIITHTVNSSNQAIGKWLEKEGIYYYYLEGNEMSIDETNDIQGEFFERELISDMGWLYNHDDIVPTFNIPWKEWCSLSINDQVELCKKYGVGYELTKLNFDKPKIVLPEHAIFSDDIIKEGLESIEKNEKQYRRIYERIHNRKYDYPDFDELDEQEDKSNPLF